MPDASSPCPLDQGNAKRTVRIIRDFDEVEKLRPYWERWQSHPNSDLDHFLLVCRQRQSVLHPYVVVLERQDCPQAILAARVETGRVAPGIGYLTPIRFSVVKLVVVYQGLLGVVDDETAGQLIGGLETALDQGEVDLVELNHVPEGSPLQCALARSYRGCRDGRLVWSVHWNLQLPREVGGLLKKMRSKHRSWVRRKTRELEETFPGRSRYRAFTTADNLGWWCTELEKVARLTYQRRLGTGFVDNSVHRERFALFKRRGMLRAWMLYVDEAPKAYAVGLVYGNTFYFSMTGYDPEFREYEIGMLIFLRMVDDLIQEGVTKFDFGTGDAGYKQRFGDHSWRETTLRLYRRNMKGLMVNATYLAMGSIARVGQGIVNRLGVVNRLKTAWRRRLVAGQQPGTRNGG